VPLPVSLANTNPTTAVIPGVDTILPGGLMGYILQGTSTLIYGRSVDQSYPGADGRTHILSGSYETA